jgi:hypothetical protein
MHLFELVPELFPADASLETNEQETSTLTKKRPTMLSKTTNAGRTNRATGWRI